MLTNKKNAVIANEKLIQRETVNALQFHNFFKPNFEVEIETKFAHSDYLNLLSLLHPDPMQYDFFMFAPTPNISSYLFACIVGPFKEVRNQKEANVSMSIFCRESLF